MSSISCWIWIWQKLICPFNVAGGSATAGSCFSAAAARTALAATAARSARTAGITGTYGQGLNFIGRAIFLYDFDARVIKRDANQSGFRARA